MNVKIVVLIVLCVVFVLILTIGTLLKLHTRRRLNDIDAFNGITSKKYLVSENAIVIKGNTTNQPEKLSRRNKNVVKKDIMFEPFN